MANEEQKKRLTRKTRRGRTVPGSRFQEVDLVFWGCKMGVERFEDLEIWQEARELCKKIRDLTSQGNFAKDYKLRDQIRDSSGSIMDCIAEGFERDGNKEFAQFLSIAKGSCGETRSQSYRAFDYEYISEESLNDLLDRTIRLSKKIASFISYLKTSDFKGLKYRP